MFVVQLFGMGGAQMSCCGNVREALLCRRRVNLARVTEARAVEVLLDDIARQSHLNEQASQKYVRQRHTSHHCTVCMSLRVRHVHGEGGNGRSQVPRSWTHRMPRTIWVPCARDDWHEGVLQRSKTHVGKKTRRVGDEESLAVLS